MSAREHQATFYRAAKKLWERYLRVGPGAVEAFYLSQVESAAAAWFEADDTVATGDLASDVRILLDLARRCVDTPNGLCFVSGEAGLVPRRDQHAQYERCLNNLAVQDERP